MVAEQSVSNDDHTSQHRKKQLCKSKRNLAAVPACEQQTAITDLVTQNLEKNIASSTDLDFEQSNLNSEKSRGVDDYNAKQYQIMFQQVTSALTQQLSFAHWQRKACTCLMHGYHFNVWQTNAN